MDTQLSRLQQLDILINAIDERLTTAETTEGQTKMGSDFISDAHAKVDEERDAISLAQERGEESDIEMHDLEDSGYTTAVEEIPGPSATGDAETSSMPGESSLDAPLINAATIWGKRNLAREYLKRGHKRLKFAQIMAHIGVKPDEQQWTELYFLIDPKYTPNNRIGHDTETDLFFYQPDADRISTIFDDEQASEQLLREARQRRPCASSSSGGPCACRAHLAVCRLCRQTRGIDLASLSAGTPSSLAQRASPKTKKNRVYKVVKTGAEIGACVGLGVVAYYCCKTV